MASAFIAHPHAPTAPAARPGRRVPDAPVLEPLLPYLRDPDVTDVFINGAAGLFVDRGRGAERVEQWRADDAAVRELAIALIGLGGRHIDDATPAADVRWEHGARVHAVLPPVACGGAAISIRLPDAGGATFAELDDRGMFGAGVAERLEQLVAGRANILISGATGAGNTTWHK